MRFYCQGKTYDSSRTGLRGKTTFSLVDRICALLETQPKTLQMRANQSSVFSVSVHSLYKQNPITHRYCNKQINDRTPVVLFTAILKWCLNACCSYLSNFTVFFGSHSLNLLGHPRYLTSTLPLFSAKTASTS